MTDTKHSADLPPLPKEDSSISWTGAEYYPVWNRNQMHEYARAAIAAAAPAGEPVAYVNGDELANMLDDRTATIAGIRDGWRATLLYAAPIPAAAPKAALTPEQIKALWGKESMGQFDSRHLLFARAVELASGPNAALVAALQELAKDGEYGTATELVARAALAAAGVSHG